MNQAIAVTIANVNEAPVIISNGGGPSASISIAENASSVTTVIGADPDAATTLTYALAGGADAAKFTINASTGALSFISAPNFEAPTDAGGDNVYDVIVQTSDGSLTASQAIAVTITNVNEAPDHHIQWWRSFGLLDHFRKHHRGHDGHRRGP